MAKVRLDKFISSTLVISRKDATSLIKSGRISVNGNTKPKGDDKVDDILDTVVFDGEKITFCENLYIMLNKPQGLISATDSEGEKTFSEYSFSPPILTSQSKAVADVTISLIINSSITALSRLLSLLKLS